MLVGRLGSRSATSFSLRGSNFLKRLCSTVAAGCGSCGSTPRHQPLSDRQEYWLKSQVQQFSASDQFESASTAPSSWYTEELFHRLDKEAIFDNAWLHVGNVFDVAKPNQYFSGTFLNEPYLVVRDEEGILRAFYNVCSHHAMHLVGGLQGGQASGIAEDGSLTCPYHGWMYRTDGKLTKATKLKNVKNFRTKDNGLKPIAVDTVGPFLFINFGGAQVPLADFAAGLIPSLAKSGAIDDDLVFVKRSAYDMDCNWKVYVDNYCDGGYHIPHAHKGLDADIDMRSYTVELSPPRLSTQYVHGTPSGERLPGRVSGAASYAHMYPNFMANRYGAWLDTNTVVPLGPEKCKVIFEWFVSKKHLNDQEFLKQSFEMTHITQEEDILLCAGVQRGLRSRAYHTGRFASTETAMHLFHQQLHKAYSKFLRL